MEQPNPHMSTCYGQLSSNQNMVVFMDFREFMRIISSTYSGWWYTYPSEKSEFVSWEYYSQYILEKNTCLKSADQLATNYIEYIILYPHMSDGYNPYK